MYPQGFGQPGGPAVGSAPSAMPVAQQVQQAQMMAVQQSKPQGMVGYGYQGFPSPYPGSPQGQFPGGGAADGGWSAAYWAQQGMGMQGQSTNGGFNPQYQQNAGASFQKGEKGSSKGKGQFSKGKGKGKSSKGLSSSDFFQPSNNAGSSDPRRQIAIAQRKAQHRERDVVLEAQRAAIIRFEQDHIHRLKGKWYDASDADRTYEVDGNLLSESAGENARVFRNRLTIYNGGICWDAKRFWCTLSIDALPPAGEDVERVEWKMGEGSASMTPIVWQRTPPEPKVAEDGETKEASADGAPDENAGSATTENAASDENASKE